MAEYEWEQDRIHQLEAALQAAKEENAVLLTRFVQQRSRAVEAETQLAAEKQRADELATQLELSSKIFP